MVIKENNIKLAEFLFNKEINLNNSVSIKITEIHDDRNVKIIIFFL